MSSQRFTLVAAGALALVLAPRPGAAQLDHLVCYKVADKTPITATFDLFAELQPEFSARGCRIVRVTDFCVPASKLNVVPVDAEVRADIAGPPLYVDYVGYLVKCEPQLAPPGKVVIDQFGTHRHRKYKIQKVYLPAKKGPPPCGAVDGKLCGGVCPNADEECLIDPDGNCSCVPAEDDVCGGKPDKQGFCGGPCPDPAKPQCQLTVTSSGAKACECGPPPPPVCGINAATGTCGGECPNKAEKCVLKSPNECTCEPATTPCSTTGAGTCGGDCPIAGDVCTLNAVNECDCGPPPPTPCTQNTLTGTCGGECPGGETCRLDAAGICACGPVPCSSDANGICGGSCPDPDLQVCKPDATGACNCDPPSCSLTGVDICGGICPPGRSCQLVQVPGGFACSCL